MNLMKNLEKIPKLEKDQETKEKSDYEKFKETIKNTDAVFVLAHGNPPEDKLTMEARWRTLATIEASKINPDLRIAFVGGHVEKFETTSEQMGKYFLVRAEKKSEEIAILDKSNNTVGNIKEIVDYLKDYPELLKVGILSSKSHLERVCEILKNLEQQYELIPFEPLVEKRSERHENLLEKYKDSWDYNKLKLIDRIMMVYLKLDPEQKFVAKFRKWSRDRQEKKKFE